MIILLGSLRKIAALSILLLSYWCDSPIMIEVRNTYEITGQLRIYRETVDPISGSVAKEEVLDYEYAH
jgi:hypothetical protein